MAVTVAVKVLHRHLLDSGSGEAIFVTKLLIDDGAGTNIAQLGPKKGVTARVLPLLEFDHDPQATLPLDCHTVPEVAGIDHVRVGILS